MSRNLVKFSNWIKECEEDLKGMPGCCNDDRYLFDNVCDLLEYEFIFELGKHKPHWRDFILDRYKNKIKVGDVEFDMITVWKNVDNEVEGNE